MVVPPVLAVSRIRRRQASARSSHTGRPSQGPIREAPTKEKIPARKAAKGVPNPFKPGELMDRPTKPAYNKVKVRALKLLKDMAT
jgi:hypothetical protein